MRQDRVLARGPLCMLLWNITLALGPRSEPYVVRIPSWTVPEEHKASPLTRCRESYGGYDGSSPSQAFSWELSPGEAGSLDNLNGVGQGQY